MRGMSLESFGKKGVCWARDPAVYFYATQTPPLCGHSVWGWGHAVEGRQHFKKDIVGDNSGKRKTMSQSPAKAASQPTPKGKHVESFMMSFYATALDGSNSN